MKTLGLKALTVGLLTAVFATAGPLTNVPARFEKENADIRKDITEIRSVRVKILTLQKELKADKKADLKGDVIKDRKNLKKLKADLKRAKKYLRADKKDLVCDYRLAMKEQKSIVKDDKTRLRYAQREQKRHIKNGDLSLLEKSEKLKKVKSLLLYMKHS
jgi:hypothetical protein